MNVEIPISIRLLIALMAVACDNSVDAGGGKADGGAIEIGPCDDFNPCPAGQTCVNGLCSKECGSDDDCGGDQYCDMSPYGDRQCHDKHIKNCPESPCESSQVCLGGYCSTVSTSTGCNPEGLVLGQDGCDHGSFCIQDMNETTRCYTFPPCPQDGVCPLGTSGAVCNEGYFPNKSRVCLVGMCRGQENCPAAWKCIEATPGAVVGMCGNGGLGSACMENEDCISNWCIRAAPGLLGLCM